MSAIEVHADAVAALTRMYEYAREVEVRAEAAEAEVERLEKKLAWNITLLKRWADDYPGSVTEYDEEAMG